MTDPVKYQGQTNNLSGVGTPNVKLNIPQMDKFDAPTQAALLKIQQWCNNLVVPAGAGGGGFPTPVPGTPIPVGLLPWGIVINNAGTLAYVCNSGATTLSTINIPANTTGTITGFVNPFNVAINAAEAYVSDIGGTAVTPITLPFTVLTAITVGNSPEGIAISPDGLHVFVCNRSSSTVSVISTASHTVVHTISTGAAVPQGVVVTASVAYVSTATNVLIYDASVYTLLGTILTGFSGYGPTLTPDGSTLYVCDNGGTNVAVIPTASNTVTALIPVGSAPIAIAITADGKRAYVCNSASNTLTPIALPANTTGAPIPVGTTPQGIAITPDGTRGYVCNTGDNTVTPISFV